MYKLVAIDIDGTLLNSNHEISEANINAIKKASEQGVKIVLCSGRPRVGVDAYIDTLGLRREGEYTINFNGAIINEIYSKKMISHISLNKNDLFEIYEVSKEINAHMHFFNEDELYTFNRKIGKYTVYESYTTGAPLSFIEPHEIKNDFQVTKAMYIDEPEILEKYFDKIPKHFFEKYSIVRSAPFYLEILNKNATKGQAVKELAKILGIEREEVICIGDQENDYSMIEYAGLGVAMGNAIDMIKEKAKYITDSNDNDGVAKVIEKFIFN